MTRLLELENVSKRFPVGKARLPWSGPPSRVHAVDDVSLTVEQGETVGLVGESGCGKSTLVRLITRLLDVTEGKIWFDRRELSEIPARVFARDHKLIPTYEPAKSPAAHARIITRWHSQ